DLFAVQNPGRMGQLLQGLLGEAPGFGQGPDLLENSPVGVAGQRRRSHEMGTDQNVAGGRRSGVLSALISPATDAAGHRGRNQNSGQSSHTGGPLNARVWAI